MFQGLLIEALLGPCRPPTSISFKRELMNCILNDLLASGRVDSICTQVDGDICTLPLIRLLGSIINKVEEGTEPWLFKCVFVTVQVFITFL